MIATGYKSEVIQDWVSKLDNDWNVTALDTGLITQTGGRIKRCISAFPSERYFVTYGDGLGNIQLQELYDFHITHGKLATVTAVRPPARFGVLELEKNEVKHFGEKNQTDTGWINGGFFIIEKAVSDWITGDFDLFETSALPSLASKGQLMGFHHKGFWQPMDTLRERNQLAEEAKKSVPPWLDFSSHY